MKASQNGKKWQNVRSFLTLGSSVKISCTLNTDVGGAFEQCTQTITYL